MPKVQNVYAINSRIAEFRRCVSLTHTLNMFILTTFLSEPFSENKEHGKLIVFYTVSHTLCISDDRSQERDGHIHINSKTDGR